MWVVAPRTSLFCVAAERPPDALADWLLLLQNDTPNEARFGLVDNSVSSTLEGATLDDMKRSVTARSSRKTPVGFQPWQTRPKAITTTSDRSPH